MDLHRLIPAAAALLLASLRCTYPAPVHFSGDDSVPCNGIDIVLPAGELSPGESISARCLLLLPDGTRREAEPGTVIWKSDDPAVAAVSFDGVITANRGGGTIIRAKAESFSAERALTVTDYSAILISEVYYDSKSSAYAEFIEIWNVGSEAVDISGFRLEDASASPRYCFPEGTIIGPDCRLVVPRDDERFKEEFYGEKFKDIILMAKSGIILGDSGETVFLKHPDGKIRDEVYLEGGDSKLPAPDSWGDIKAPNAPRGSSAFRTDRLDTDTSADWSVGLPTPGY